MTRLPVYNQPNWASIALQLSVAITRVDSVRYPIVQGWRERGFHHWFAEHK